MTWFALVDVIAICVAYNILIRSQGDPGAPGAPDVLTVPFVTAYMLLMATLLAVSLLRPTHQGARTAMRAAAAGGLLVLGILALFSIGLPLVIAGAMATGATVRTLRGPHWTSASLVAVACAFVAVAVLVAGFEASERYIVCPATGSASGGGVGLVSGPYHYDCVNGVLSFHSG